MAATAFGIGTEAIPFREAPWTGDAEGAASAFWEWHKALAKPLAPALDGTDLDRYFDSQEEAIRSGGTPEVVEDHVWSRVRPYAEDERVRSLLADQIAGARVLGLPRVSFDDRAHLLNFIDGYIVPHAVLLARLCGASRDFQRPRIAAIGEALFLHARLVGVRKDLAAGRCFYTSQELNELGVTTTALITSPPSEAVRKLVWRRIVWIRDAFARGMPLAEEVPRPIARYLKHAVMLSLEVLAQIERDDYDLGAFEPGLSRYHRAQAWIQSRFGRTAWR